MSLSRSVVAALVVTAALVPALAFAQSYNCNTATNTNWSFWGNNTTTCAPGHLLVYVQVTNPINNGYNRASSDFTVTVSGINPSPSSFPGSLSGTQVTVGGSYSVTALQLQGYNVSYSAGCTGVLNQGESAQCVITESNAYDYYNNQYPTPYPYGYTNIPLTCTPSYQTVNLGQTATFVAQGGDYSQYNWQTPQHAFLNIGQTLNTQFVQTGTQTVTVTNGTETAQCTVNVVASGAPVPVVVNSVTPVYPITGTGYGSVYVTPTYVPGLPNTGFAPLSATEAASAVAIMIAMAFALLPYVRKAFAVVLN